MAAAGNDYRQLSFVVRAFGNLWPQNGATVGQQGAGRLEEKQGLDGNLVVEFGGVLAVIASDADDFCRLNGSEEHGVVERNVIHAAAREAFDVAITGVRRLQQQARDLVGAPNGLDQSVVGLAIELEAAIFHGNLSKHER
jgi:hypothetical protein